MACSGSRWSVSAIGVRSSILLDVSDPNLAIPVAQEPHYSILHVMIGRYIEIAFSRAGNVFAIPHVRGEVSFRRCQTRYAADRLSRAEGRARGRTAAAYAVPTTC